MEKKKSGRLFSLDLLRGLDIFLLTAVGPFVWAVHRTWGDYDNPAWWLDQVKHPAFGFSTWDIIMPLFLFMSGAAVPLGFSKRLDANGRPTSAFWKHLLKRFLLLWLLSVFTHGNLCALDPVKTNIFSGALLVIAVATVVVSLWMLIPSRRVQVAVPLVVLAIFAVATHLWGDYSLEGSLSGVVEATIRGWLRPEGYVPPPPPPGRLPWSFFVPMVVYAGVIAPSGALCVQYIQSTGSGLRKTLTIAGVGIALLAAGWAISPWVPMTKRIMTTSFTLAALGWCLLALAACYYITDVKGWRKGLWIFTLYGQCSLAAYVIDEQFRATFRSAAQPFIGGLVQWFGAQYQEMFLWVFMIAVQTYVLFVWREYRSRS